MKNMTLPVAVFVAILGCGLAVIANVTTSRMHAKLEGERYRRIALEEQLQKSDQIINSLEMQLADAESKIATVQSILSGTEEGNTSLREQLKQTDAQKKALAEKIQQLQKQDNDGGMSGGSSGEY